MLVKEAENLFAISEGSIMIPPSDFKEDGKDAREADNFLSQLPP